MMSQCEWPSSLLDWQNRQQKERKEITQPSGLQLLAGSPEYSGWDERLFLRMRQDKSWNTICWRWRTAWSVSSGFSLGKRRDEWVCDGRNVLLAGQNVWFCLFFIVRGNTHLLQTGFVGNSKWYLIILDDWSEVDFNLSIFSHKWRSKGTFSLAFYGGLFFYPPFKFQKAQFIPKNEKCIQVKCH